MASLARIVETLPAPAFSFVMASGIVSISLHMHGLDTLSWILLGIAAAGYLVLLVLSALQIHRFPQVIRTYLRSPSTRFAFFTFGAGSDVLGSRLILADVRIIPIIQLTVAIAAWILLAFLIWKEFGRDTKPWTALVDGSWFLASVAANSIGVAAASIAIAREEIRLPLAMVALVGWLVGLLCYLVILTGVIVRIFRHQLTAESLTAPFWITMGACAITVLNSFKIAAIPLIGFFVPIASILSYVGLIVWVFATALIPLILAAGWWRHMVHKVALDNTVMLWSIVFPLGMYDVASTLTANAFDLPLAQVIGAVGVWLALAAWMATIARHIWLRYRPLLVR